MLALLRTLARCEVRFIVVGGVSAVLHGVPMSNLDVDIVHARDRANVERLLSALADLDAVYRFQPERRVRPTASHLASPGLQLLLTRLGALDALGTIGNGRTYEDLLPHSTEMELGEGLRTRILNLSMLITTKEEAGNEKDLTVLPLLRRALQYDH